MLVGFTVAVPVELDLDPTVLVGPGLLVPMADDDGGLKDRDPGFRRDPGTTGYPGVQGGELAPEDGTRICRVGGAEGVGPQFVLGTRSGIPGSGRVERRIVRGPDPGAPGVVGQLEAHPGAETACSLVAHMLLFDARPPLVWVRSQSQGTGAAW